MGQVRAGRGSEFLSLQELTHESGEEPRLVFWDAPARIRHQALVDIVAEEYDDDIGCSAGVESVTDRLHATFASIPHGWFRLIFPVFLLNMRREERANMRLLRDAVERRTQASR